MIRVFTGTVTSTNMQKTVTVVVERKFRHPVYRKVIIRHKKFMAHNDDKTIKVGDKVKIAETRPISKHKHYKVVEKIV